MIDSAAMWTELGRLAARLDDIEARLPQAVAEDVLVPLVRAAHAVFDTQTFTARALYLAASGRTPEVRTLKAAIDDAVAPWPDGQPRRLGIFLAKGVGTVVDDLRLARQEQPHRDGAVYRILRVCESQDPQAVLD